jgi:hypothetical protein
VAARAADETFAHGSMRATGAKKESNEVELSCLLTDRGKATRPLARPRPKHCPGYASQLVGGILKELGKDVQIRFS